LCSGSNIIPFWCHREGAGQRGPSSVIRNSIVPQEFVPFGKNLVHCEGGTKFTAPVVKQQENTQRTSGERAELTLN